MDSQDSWWTIPVASLVIVVSAVLFLLCRHTQTDGVTDTRTNTDERLTPMTVVGMSKDHYILRMLIYLFNQKTQKLLSVTGINPRKGYWNVYYYDDWRCLPLFKRSYIMSIFFRFGPLLRKLELDVLMWGFTLQAVRCMANRNMGSTMNLQCHCIVSRLAVYTTLIYLTFVMCFAYRVS